MFLVLFCDLKKFTRNPPEIHPEIHTEIHPEIHPKSTPKSTPTPSTRHLPMCSPLGCVHPTHTKTNYAHNERVFLTSIDTCFLTSYNEAPTTATIEALRGLCPARCPAIQTRTLARHMHRGHAANRCSAHLHCTARCRRSIDIDESSLWPNHWQHWIHTATYRSEHSCPCCNRLPTALRHCPLGGPSERR